jgi:hypothetical protein
MGRTPRAMQAVVERCGRYREDSKDLTTAGDWANR